MKKHLNFILFFLIIISQKVHSQVNANNYTWLKGSNIVDQTGYYGMAGNTLNTPGAREGATTWTLNGKLYLFGGIGMDGVGNSGVMNDLWEYNPTNNNWTWLKGPSTRLDNGNYGTIAIPSPTNLPPARNESSNWVVNGKLYLFAGLNSVAHRLTDLWEYNPTTNNWTWIKGPSSPQQFGVYGSKGLANENNYPGSRQGAATWEYNGNLYLFGGLGRASIGLDGVLNDLWVYNINENNWTWIGGENNIDQLGIYGTQGVGSVSNIPGGRTSFGYCQVNNIFYLFGGFGYSEGLFSGLLNDLWEYNAINGQWKYLKGDKTINNNGIYNTQTVYNPATKLGSRSSTSLISYNSKLYLFGGYGLDVNDTSPAELNDLMIYDIKTNNWVWQRGNENSGGNGSYGTQGTTNTTNRPSARSGHSAWYLNHKIYLFGGHGEASVNGTFGELNDLWSYVPTCSGTTDFYSLKNGNWNDPAVWSCGSVPTTTEQITIKGHTININGNFGVNRIIFEGGNVTIPVGSTLTYYPIVP